MLASYTRGAWVVGVRILLLNDIFLSLNLLNSVKTFRKNSIDISMEYFVTMSQDEHQLLISRSTCIIDASTFASTTFKHLRLDRWRTNACVCGRRTKMVNISLVIACLLKMINCISGSQESTLVNCAACHHVAWKVTSWNCKVTCDAIADCKCVHRYIKL